MKTKQCFRCKKVIDDKEDYYSFTEYHKEKIIKIEYTHKKCWNDFLGKVSSTQVAQDFLSRINFAPLEKLGILKPKKVIIK